MSIIRRIRKSISHYESHKIFFASLTQHFSVSHTDFCNYISNTSIDIPELVNYNSILGNNLMSRLKSVDLVKLYKYKCIVCHYSIRVVCIHTHCPQIFIHRLCLHLLELDSNENILQQQLKTNHQSRFTFQRYRIALNTLRSFLSPNADGLTMCETIEWNVPAIQQSVCTDKKRLRLVIVTFHLITHINSYMLFLPWSTV